MPTRKSFNDHLSDLKAMQALASLHHEVRDTRLALEDSGPPTPRRARSSIDRLDAKMKQLLRAFDRMAETPPHPERDGTFHGTSLSLHELPTPHQQRPAEPCRCPPGNTKATCPAMIHTPPAGYRHEAFRGYTYMDAHGQEIATKVMIPRGKA